MNIFINESIKSATLHGLCDSQYLCLCVVTREQCMCLTNLFSSQLTHKNITTLISFLARSVESSWLCFNKFFQHDLECFQ